MRVLLSTIGSRGDVQPLVALALELRALGNEARFCVPPDFRAWIERLGFPVTPVGPELRATAQAPAAPPTLAQRRAMMEGTVAAQFQAIGEAARGCDAILGATALQLAAPSVAEQLGIPYVFAAYCPAVLPSSHHAPPPLTPLPAPHGADPRALWAQDAERWNVMWGPILNAHRASLGLPPVGDVRAHVLTPRPWLAADPSLAPWPGDEPVFQPGAWLLPDERPLPHEVEAFLDAGDPPVYLGFGSIRAPADLARTVMEAARALGRRVLLSRGWAGLECDGGSDCLTIGEINQQALFRRLAAIVHHGGAGTTTAAARAGTPQVIIPQIYDQHYWARRVHDLGIGVAHPPGTPDATTLTQSIERAITTHIQPIPIRTDGAKTAARHLCAL